MKSFPDGFLWGVSTAGHQIEGENTHSDWYEWERKGKVRNGDTSDRACGSWNNLERDLEILKELKVKAYRYSLEWARIEPVKDKFDKTVLERYRRFTESLLQYDIQPIITLNHFVLPQWFANLGGWERRENLDYFKRFTETVVKELKDLVHFWITINEPNVYASMSYLMGEWPPEVKDMERARCVLKNLLFAHTLAYDTIKSVKPTSMVSIALNVMPFLPARRWHPGDCISSAFLGKLYNYSFVDSLKLGHIARPLGKREPAPELKGKLDFLGINYYTRTFVRFARPLPRIENGSEFDKTDMGYEFYPQGLKKVVVEMSRRYSMPIMITENGIADATDSKRYQYIETALDSLAQAMKKGAKVFGYLYWSLMDNFEWREGYSMKFGLYETIQDTMELKARPSAEKFRKIIEENS